MTRLEEAGIELAEICVNHLSNMCDCSEEYKNRDQIDPQCEYCHVGVFVLTHAQEVLSRASIAGYTGCAKETAPNLLPSEVLDYIAKSSAYFYGMIGTDMIERLKRHSNRLLNKYDELPIEEEEK